MDYYPIFLDVKDRECLVVGGGAVGTRKAFGLVRAGARVIVVSFGFSEELSNTPFSAVTLKEKKFEDSDLDGMSLAFAATDNMQLNARIRQAAQKKNILCNIADGRDKGDFILPAVVDRGDLLFAVSTCGASPALSRRLRMALEARFGPEYGILTALLGSIRAILLERGHDPKGHRKIFCALLDANLPEKIAAGQTRQIDAVLAKVIGDGFSLDRLMPDFGTREL
ncbi:bifunctional precorrin-2 dehydrogenase/sirohydrochlorin ferrochelatase [Desulfobacter hydrogenophilus]|uniref:precorrin-2 dehydrogenase n=2 Tax=Desulfobacter hydrogenophilus TaxID=2291 RepID=A0A328FE30_9BACT|nr:bifunctional precorrin-2 dehydrogenase/sirohydrochlorin ferrochelatase [Desulfobacter hydrogenophilus]QBH15498.1 bifunctional precorrin-2 dehydrogenase/sirohydrochlorin ferrochelatase [Desulfobacter hydrogenophilus]RAM02569.1 bifunctional precorrin-2 dehydrogenase/sirohydrochlorin ferrochelatase [Desulfobacter hydrogenophilus]